MHRRQFLKAAALAPFLTLAPSAAAPLRPGPWAVIGDVSGTRARIAAGGMGHGPLKVFWNTGADSGVLNVTPGSTAARASDFTAQAQLSGLPAGQTIHYRASIGKAGVTGSFRTAAAIADRPVRFLWGGDVAGQGWGIDPSRGGMLTFQTMQNEDPDFFIHCGDTIYADGVLPVERRLDDGTVWKNILTLEKSKVAETLSDFHGNYRYNFLDTHYRDFFRQVPVIAQWDDHEVFDNWDPVAVKQLASDAFRAFRDYWPMDQQSPELLYRKISYGPNVDVFVLDLRSHRGSNSNNLQTKPSKSTALLGENQLKWFKDALAESKATWKIVAGEMPISTFSPRFGRDNWTNGPGKPLGREFELVDILGHIRSQDIKNVVWLSADVHYALAVKFDPAKAAYNDFNPFWEFVAGPLHSGTFSPTEDLDSTFGAQEVFCSVPRDLKPDRPPSDDLQFYGKVEATRRRLEVSLHQRRGKELYRVELDAE